MEITPKLTKPIHEAKYLNVENTDRYRVIIRYFFEQYEKLKYWLYQEEVFEHLIGYDYFSDYTLEQCTSDLSALVNWNNLIPTQDTRKVTSLEEFKNKKFRYQLSEYTVEIERMVLRLESLTYEGASLEPSLIERIGQYFDGLETMSSLDMSQIDVLMTWWNDLNNDFIRLNQNYQDYMRELSSLRAEEMMQTREFLLYKEQLLAYLKSFVRALQLHVGKIENKIKEVHPSSLEKIFQMVHQHEQSIPRFAYEIDDAALLENISGRYHSIRTWFISDGNNTAEWVKVFDMTNEIIRKITRYAQRISERSSSGANRKDEYLKLAKLFGECKSLLEAHKLSACVFGVGSAFHLKAEIQRQTDSANSGVYEEEPHVVTIRPRTRQYREKSRPTGIVNRSVEKEAIRKKALEKMERDIRLAHNYIREGKLTFANLPVISGEERECMLNWLSKGLEDEKKQGKTENGLTFTVFLENERERCQLHCSDGVFEMPSFQLIFDEETA